MKYQLHYVSNKEFMQKKRQRFARAETGLETLRRNADEAT